MGALVIPELPVVRFERTTYSSRVWEEVDQKDAELIGVLRNSSKPVSRGELEIDANGLLTLEGRKVVAYIRDQRQGVNAYAQTSSYRFHVCDCNTMQRMRYVGRERRYLATQRRDEWFEVHDLSGYRPRKVLVRLQLCKHCLEELRARGVCRSSFSLREFFERYDSTVPRTVRREETVSVIQTYTPDQADLSREYRKAVNFKCQRCSVSCSDEHDLLNLHHRDGDPSNNEHANLRVFCVECHSQQPYHAQVARTSKAQYQIARIGQLRRAQGLADLDFDVSNNCFEPGSGVAVPRTRAGL